MMSRAFALLAALFIADAAARTEAIANFQNLPIKRQMSTLEARDRIISGAGRHLVRPWTMIDAGDGKLIGRLNVRKHQVVVEVTYSESQYSILYKDSTRLDYDARDRSINAMYNVWVRELQDALDQELNATTARPSSPRAPAATPAAAVPARGNSAEITFWESVRNSQNPAELQAYLDQYPNGVFAPLARARLQTLRR